MEERRSTNAHRRRTLKKGRVVLSDSTVMDCLVRDLTETGARLEFAAPVGLPPDFRLLVVGSNLLMPSALSWQRGLSAGVHFTGIGQPAPPKL